MRETIRTAGRVCVVGAGVTGLVAACSLARSGYSVTVLESELRPGGMLSTFRIGWEDLERVPHLLRAGDRDALGLFRDLGLQDLIEWFPPSAALYLDGARHRITHPADVLRIGAAPLPARLRAAFAATARGVPPFRCERSLDVLAAALRPGRRESAPGEWLLCALARPPLSEDQKGEAGYPAGGFSVLVRALLKEIEAHGGEVRCGCTVTDIRLAGDRFRLDCILEDCTSAVVEADRVAATVSGRRFAEMGASAGLPEEVLERLRCTRNLGHLCLALRLKAPLSPYHRTLVPSDAPFRLVTEHTGLVGLRRYGGHIVYLSRDLDTADPLWTAPDGDVFRLFFRRLSEMHAGLLRSDVKDWRLSRSRYACPADAPLARAAVRAAEASCPGLYLAGVAGTLSEEHSLDRSVRAGLDLAERARREPALRTEGAPAPAVPQSEVD